MMKGVCMIGLGIGIITFLLIGIFHPVVIKSEYYFGVRKPCYVFIFIGILAIVLAVFIENLIMSIIFGVLACCSFWSIKEMREQEERVLKGWFPENPNRQHYYNEKRESYFELNPQFKAMYEAKKNNT